MIDCGMGGDIAIYLPLVFDVITLFAGGEEGDTLLEFARRWG